MTAAKKLRAAGIFTAASHFRNFAAAWFPPDGGGFLCNFVDFCVAGGCLLGEPVGKFMLKPANALA